MENALERIWAYIDGDLTEETKNTFEKHLAEDSSLKALYNAQLKLHNGLKMSPIIKAPSGMADIIMSKVVKPKFSAEKYNSFVGFRNILLAAIGFSILISCIVLVLSSSSSAPTEANYILNDYISKINFTYQLPDFFTKYSICFILFFVIPLFGIMDNYFRNRLVYKYR